MTKGIVIAFVAACSGPPDHDDHADASGTGAGVTISWHTATPLPGPVSSAITVSTATFRVRNLRVIGDSGDVDDKDVQTIGWASGLSPADLVLTDSPPGLYSRISFEFDGHVAANSYELTGTVVLAGQARAFAIRDLGEIHYTLALDQTLAPGGNLALPLTLDLTTALGDVDFSMLPVDDDTLVLGTTSSQIGKFRADLAQAFTAPVM